MRHAAPGQVTGDWLDSLELSRIALPRLRSHRLAALVEVFGAPESTHRAMDDVLALCAIWRIMLVALSDFTPGLLASIRDLHPRIDWPLRKVIARIAAQDPTPAITLGELRAKALHQESGTIKLDAQDQTLCFAPREDIARCFQPDSMLSAMYPGFEPRAEQVEMACEVQRAFSTDGISAIEAGTGVGKSMAYLLPAALLAQGNGIGVGVATKTNALMDQLIYNGLPRLATQRPQGLRYVAIKGYEHDPCLRKMQAMASMDPEPSEDEDGKRRDLARITLLASIYAFLDQSAWADFDAIPLHWSDLPRKAICASSGDCLHNRCRFFPQFCLIHGLRQMARCADIVVTNHALLFRDAASEGALLPPIRHWIVDEAHAVEDEARKQLSLCADVRDLRGELAHLAKGPSSVMAHAIRKAKQVEGGQLITICAVKVEEEANRCDAIAESFFSFVKDLAEHAEKSSYDVVELWVNEQLRETGTWSVVAGTGRSLANHLTTLTDLCKELLSCIDSQESRLWDVAADVKGSCCHLEEARDAVDLCVNVQDPDYVYSASLNRRPDVPAEALNASLLDVGNALNQLFYPRVQSVVYT
ncbi:MAG: DNA polymerase III subunit epsilon, partial [Coriobacteriales bacterium]|nr:DNA polymerase III subunit epsilon [Coriobacteriales bacterium]